LTSLLVLGGTRFVGAAVVDDALARGWSVTVFNRGVTDDVPTGAEWVRGDRTDPADRAALVEHGPWDFCVDAWSLAPSVVLDAAQTLRPVVGRYGYVSSRSVYGDPLPTDADESAPVVDASPDADATDYAADKRGGELAAEAAFGTDVVHARAGLILGPRENIDRLPWWLRRLRRGGRVLAPGPVDTGLQYVDARDLAAFLLSALAVGESGPFNIVSEPAHTTMGELLDVARSTVGAAAELEWVDAQFLLDHDVAPWTELPIWVPPHIEDYSIHLANVSRALAAGLRCRPVGETVADTWAWMQTLPSLDPPPPVAGRPATGMAAEREEQLLAEWDAR
jgi:nucleoside-diphosphate-sugar epimerase